MAKALTGDFRVNTGHKQMRCMGVAQIVKPDAGQAAIDHELHPHSQPAAGEPRLTKNQQTMFSLLHAVGQAGQTTDEWNARARAEGIGVKRRADLVACRLALKAKNMVREYADSWHVAV
jgi:hypothetical protein